MLDREHYMIVFSRSSRNDRVMSICGGYLYRKMKSPISYTLLRNSWGGFHRGYFCTSNPSFLTRQIFVSRIAKYLCPNKIAWKSILSTSYSTLDSLFWGFNMREMHGLERWQPIRYRSNAIVTVDTANNVARFCIDEQIEKKGVQQKGMKKVKKKMSRKAKLNELKWYRLKAKKKMKSPNPEVRIRYKLDKAKRKEEWLIEKLRKFEMPKAPEPEHDPEILTEEEKFYLKRTGEKKKNYVPLGRRGVFGGVVLNMHLHWKNHETVKVICKPCRPGQVYEYAKELTRLSKGTVIDIKADNTILFYRGKNYERPEVMSPPDTLSKQKALDKYKFEQSLEHTGQFIEKLEKELEDYHKHIAVYKNLHGTFSDSLTAIE
ncbi:uncharacterized CRM domain-containing protein At3g25440, chloroplastic [Phalaenopsis equestris]|uniref:uncharacterized CRM domain-containing protein At3g25440, chloroplastic n=1 Tax=Phalaenopsis equestris TaxID=78828 RepID=UPI0009E2E2D0|nr:uncharacterized CRM domain-containing protein At3g25440, chloroplastic [Phalaenopsis equestris]